MPIYESNTSGEPSYPSQNQPVDKTWTPLDKNPPTVSDGPDLEQFKNTPRAKGAWDTD